ncbi:MAG: aspartate/glutamate racemase family protein [Chloroflexi bacterium]|nr:aspartate/glutamate racemase family protein [Chloroflexota bacterium]
MKTIGLLGGMSWQSTVEYYRIINEEVANRLGGLHSAKLVMSSIDFAEMEELQHTNRWTEAGEMLAGQARGLKSAGADFLLICANTMHKVAGAVEAGCGLPVLHIADTTADEVKRAGIKKIGLLGTRYTMEEDFYRVRLAEKHGLEVMIPSADDRAMINRVIYDELCRGITRPESKKDYLRVIQTMADGGAGGIILGCTEIELLVKPTDFSLPLFPTTKIHAQAAVELALA